MPILRSPHYLRILNVLAELLPDHRVQPGHPGHTFGQPGFGRPSTRAVHQLDVVMVLGQSSPTNSHNGPPGLDADHLVQPAGKLSAT
jgi:hypothetical protein